MLSDKQIKDCEWFEDEMDRHFDDFIAQKKDGCDWLDVGREGARLVGLIIGEEIESDSYLDVVITSISGASESLVYGRIASALGMTKEMLEISIDRYLSSGLDPSVENFSEFCKTQNSA